MKQLSRAERGELQNVRVYNRDGWRCVYCGYNGDSPEQCPLLVMDHVNPATKSIDDLDPDYDDQKVTACILCNTIKGSFRPAGRTRDEMVADARRFIEQQKTGKWCDWYKKHRAP